MGGDCWFLVYKDTGEVILTFDTEYDAFEAFDFYTDGVNAMLVVSSEHYSSLYPEAGCLISLG